MTLEVSELTFAVTSGMTAIMLQDALYVVVRHVHHHVRCTISKRKGGPDVCSVRRPAPGQ